jgi:phosphonate transport system permease protein
MRTRKFESETKPSLVPPIVAGLVSLVLPGFGHMLARAFGKGLTLFLSIVAMTGLWIWRVRLEARREVDFLAMFQKSIQLRPILLIILILIVLIYLWIAYDAYKTADKRKKPKSGFLWLLVFISFFLLGWQIGEIQPATLITEGKNSFPLLSRVLWPWEKAIYRPEEYLTGYAEVVIPCTEGVELEPVVVEEGDPVVTITPTCGNLSEIDGDPGTTLTMTGSGFLPNTETEIWWIDQVQNKFRHRAAGDYVKVTTDENGSFSLDVVIPYRVIPATNEEGYVVWRLQGSQLASVGEPVPSEELLLAIEKMIETIFLGMMSTIFGIILSVPISFLAARNLMSANKITLAIYFVVRFVLNIIRSIEPLVWAVIAIIAVGLGPFAGIIALTIHGIAALGKLYSEAIESIDSGPLEAINATGANWLQLVWYGVIPQIIPPFVSFTIYRWDINVRMSTVIGMVGGGGIGYLLVQWIRLLDYRSAGIAIWFIAITVAILDYVSAEIRARFV